MKKMYVITNSSFPFGNANSNYIRYFSLALVELGWDVTVISSNMFSGNCETGEYKKIKFHNLQFSESKIPFHLRDHFSYGVKLKAELDKLKIENEAFVFVYSMYMDLVKTVLKELKDHLLEGHLSIGMVEWFQPSQYRFGKLNPDYLCWKHTFEKLVPQYPKVFPISRNLEKYYKSKGCQTMCLPIMADTQTHKNDGELVRKDEKFNFIYAGVSTKKDSMDGMLKALLHITDDERKKVQFHFTIMSKEELIASHISEEEYDKIKDCFVFHGWLEFDELFNLYKQMDYLFLPREENIVTLSNFPSKVPELMCYGVVPVCSNVGDYTELYLRDGIDSIQFDGAGEDECLKAIKKAVGVSASELSALKANARKSAEDLFDYHKWADDIAKFLEQ